jgi:outer membrane protein OmpA-like peptidoglycan-associated protein
MNFNKAGKYLSLILLVLAIFSISIGISVAAGENSSSTQTVDFNNYISYSNHSNTVNADHKSVSNLENGLNNSNFNTSGITSGISFNLNNYTDSSDEDRFDVFALSNENPLNVNISQASIDKLKSIQTNVSEVFSEQLFNISYFDKDWYELIELEFGSHKFMVSKLLISDPLNHIGQINASCIWIYRNINKLNKKVRKIPNFGYFNKNLLDNFSTVDLHKNKYPLVNENQIKNNNSLFYIFNNSKNNSKIYSNKLLILDNYSSYGNDNDNVNDEDEPSDSRDLDNGFIFYFNSFKSSNEFYKALDNNKFYGELIPLKASAFNMLDSYLFLIQTVFLMNNSKIYSNKLLILDNYSSYGNDNDNNNDEDEPFDSINLDNGIIFYFNSFKSSNEFYKALDNNKFYGKLISLGSSNFNILGSYSITDCFSNEIKNKYTVVNENQVKNNNSLFNIFNNSKIIPNFKIILISKNNSKVYANKLSVPENCSSDDDDNDEDEPSDSIDLGNGFIFYFNSFETSNEFYKILDNTEFYGKLILLKTSTFKILDSYSTTQTILSNEISSFEIVDIRNDSHDFHDSLILKAFNIYKLDKITLYSHK